MSSDHRTITFNEVDIEIEESDDDEHHSQRPHHLPPVVAIEEDLEGEEDNEGEDPELVIHAKEIEERNGSQMLRRFAPPSSLQLGHKAGQDHVVFKDGKDAIGGAGTSKGPAQQRKQSTAQG